jgi:4-hydroxy-tetrahydrodipicolinate synthase
MSLPNVIGIKVATLDSVMTFQRIAAVMRAHTDKLLITGEDRFLGYSLMMGARAALIGMGAALTDIQAELISAKTCGDEHAFSRLSAQVDAFSQVTFVAPMEGYIRRICDDPWGPALPAGERDRVRRAVREARQRV